MLRSMELDDESYQDILNDAISSIPDIYRSWTNYNSSDPGITLIELFAWLTEIQRYHLNYIGEENLLRYLNLLGQTPREAVPSETWLTISGSSFVPAKTAYYAEHIPFETEYDIDATENKILYAESCDEKLTNASDAFSDISVRLAFSPFKQSGKAYFTLAFDKPFEEDKIISLYFELSSEINGEGINENFVPYIKYHIEISNGILARKAFLIKDTTYGFSKSGVIVFKIPSGLYSGNYSLLKFVVDEGECEYPPTISSIVPNAVPARQQLTCCYSRTFNTDTEKSCGSPLGFKAFVYGIKGDILVPIRHSAVNGSIYFSDSGYSTVTVVFYRNEFCDSRFIGYLNGESNAVLKTGIKNIIPSSTGIFIQEHDGIYRWSRVENFDNSNRYSRHFMFKNGEFIFGDGDRGMPPKGEAFFSGAVISENEEGNVKEFAIDHYDPFTGTTGRNIIPSEGGRPPMSIDECFEEARRDMSISECCVTPEDFEREVRTTPGVSVKRVKAFVRENTENTIYIAVETHRGRSRISGKTLLNLENNIKNKKMVGTRVVFVQPGYARISLALSVSSDPTPEVRTLTEQAVRDYMKSGEINFGGKIIISSLSGYIVSLPFIRSVNSIELDLLGSGGRQLRNGDIKLKENYLPYLERVDIDFK